MFAYFIYMFSETYPIANSAEVIWSVIYFYIPSLFLVFFISVCISLPEVPDLTGGRGLDLPHFAGAGHGSGQLGHGLRHRLLPRR